MVRSRTNICSLIEILQENYKILEDTKGIFRRRKSNDTQYNDQRKNDNKTSSDLQYTVHYIENYRSRNTNTTITRGLSQVLRTGKQFLLH